MIAVGKYTQTVVFKVTPEFYERLKHWAHREKRTVSALIRVRLMEIMSILEDKDPSFDVKP